MYVTTATKKGKDATTEAIVKTENLDEALLRCISLYRTGDYDVINVLDDETGELLARYDANPERLWQSNELTSHMIDVIISAIFRL